MYNLTRNLCVVVNARLESNRIANKMVADFAETNLFEICIRKLLTSKTFEPYDIIVSHNESSDQFENIIYKIKEDTGKVFTQHRRSKESTTEENDQHKIYEFYKLAQEIGYQYCILINPCCPLLSIETIDAFYSTFKYSEYNGLFGVIKKKNYIWGHDKRTINLPRPGEIMNTKNESCLIYEAAHCLYGSKLDLINEGKWMGGFTKEGPELFIIPENETLDIDYPWQFDYVEMIYKGLNK